MTVKDDVRHIGIFLFDGVEELDAVGPYEVLGFWTQAYPKDGVRRLDLLGRRRAGERGEGAGHRRAALGVGPAGA
jgi:hypothetical protein